MARLDDLFGGGALDIPCLSCKKLQAEIGDLQMMLHDLLSLCETKACWTVQEAQFISILEERAFS